MLETDELYFEPSQSQFRECISEIFSAFQDCALAFPNLIPDPYFHSFTRYNVQLFAYSCVVTHAGELYLFDELTGR